MLFLDVRSVLMEIVVRTVSIHIICKEENVSNVILSFLIAKYAHLLINAPSVMITISSKLENVYFAIISCLIVNFVKVLLRVRRVRWISSWILTNYASFAKM